MKILTVLSKDMLIKESTLVECNGLDLKFNKTSDGVKFFNVNLNLEGERKRFIMDSDNNMVDRFHTELCNTYNNETILQLLFIEVDDPVNTQRKVLKLINVT